MATAGTVSSTRSDDQNHKETDSEFLDFENSIDMNDLAIFVFAKIADSASDDEKLVYKFTNLLNSNDAHIDVIGSKGNYFVDLMIPKDYLKNILGYEIKPDGKKYIIFRMLILANCSTSTTNTTDIWDTITGQTFSSIITQLAEWNFPMSDIYNADGGPNVETLYKKNHCPMFGTNVFAVSEPDLFNSRLEHRINLGEVNLLRSLAKVRVVDNIQNKDTQGFPYIVEAEFLSSQNQASQLPAGASNYEDGLQVHTPNIFQENSNLTCEGTYKLGILPESWTMTPQSQRKGNVFIGFVPEQKIGNPNNNIEVGMPIFHIKIANKKADETIENLDYYVPMTSYNGVNFSFGKNILRNHIYTLSVNDFGAELKMQVDVVPYRSCVLEPYFGLDRD